MYFLIQCVNAYTALKSLSSQEMDYKTAHAIVQLKRKLQPHVDFFAEQETKLANEFAAKNDRGEFVWVQAGAFQLKDPNSRGEYFRRRAELERVEIEEDFLIKCTSVPASITPAHLEALEGFVDFGLEE